MHGKKNPRLKSGRKNGLKKGKKMEILLKKYLAKFETWWENNIEPTAKNFDGSLKKKLEKRKERFNQNLDIAVSSYNADLEKIPLEKKNELDEDFDRDFNERLERFEQSFRTLKRVNKRVKSPRLKKSSTKVG